MISPDTESQIVKLLLTLSDYERQVEINRQVLAQNLDFDAYQAFRYIDTDDINSLDAILKIPQIKMGFVLMSKNYNI